MDTPHGPLVLFVVVAAVVNATLVLHAEEPLLNVGGSSGEATGPASLWLSGAADTEPAALDSLQLTVTLPTAKVAATPETRDAWKLSPAGVTVVDEAAALAGEARARHATDVAAAAIARRVRLRRVGLMWGSLLCSAFIGVDAGRRSSARLPSAPDACCWIKTTNIRNGVSSHYGARPTGSGLPSPAGITNPPAGRRCDDV
jgi:hypothetical protein